MTVVWQVAVRYFWAVFFFLLGWYLYHEVMNQWLPIVFVCGMLAADCLNYRDKIVSIKSKGG